MEKHCKNCIYLKQNALTTKCTHIISSHYVTIPLYGETFGCIYWNGKEQPANTTMEVRLKKLEENIRELSSNFIIHLSFTNSRY